MEMKIMNSMPLEYSQYNGELTREYKVNTRGTPQNYFFNICSQLDYVPMFDSKNAIWEKIMTDLLEEKKDAWEKLSEM